MGVYASGYGGTDFTANLVGQLIRMVFKGGLIKKKKK